jgi:hypothetical protein
MYIVMILLRFLALIALLIPLVAYSDTEPKIFNLGIGYYSLQIDKTYSDETYPYDTKRLDGVSFSAAYMFSDNVALRGTYYTLNQSDFIDADEDGWEVFAFYGSGLATRGSKWYIGGGYFRDQLNGATESNSFDGLQLGGGFGYNWERYAFEMLLTMRNTTDYDTHLGVSGTEINTAGVLSLLLSARF